MTDCWSSNGAICPYCEHENQPKDENWSLFDENTSEFECNDCGREFRVSVFTSYTWVTEPSEADDRQFSKAISSAEEKAQ
jgi:transposase-like protein